MGNTLTGQIVADTYDALLKVTDNNQITGTKKRLTDGFGTDTPILVSTTDLQIDGNFLTESVQFNTATAQTADAVGKLVWNDADGTLDLRLKGGNVTLQVGQEQVLRVVNKAGANLLESNYQAVRVTGAQGNRLKVDLAQANNDLNSAETIGLVTETINDNQEGFITTSGLVRGINTTGSLQGETWADGDMLYLSGTTAGRITNVKPSAPTHTIIIGYVVSAHITQGQIFVKVDNGYELDELHNVLITTPANGQVLAYEASTGLWKNASNGNVGGSGTANYLSKWSAGTTLTNSIIYDNGTNVGIGTSSPSSKLDVYVASGQTDLQISSGTEYVRLFYRDNDDNFGLFINGATRMRAIGTVGNIAFMENGSGNMIVGGMAASATAKLHVAGSGYFSGSVGFNATSVNASARVQIDSTTQGFLPPRMTSAQRTAIASPAVGLVVYQTDGTEGLYNYKSTGWALV